MIISTVIKVVGLRFVFSAIIIFDPLNQWKQQLQRDFAHVFESEVIYPNCF